MAAVPKADPVIKLVQNTEPIPTDHTHEVLSPSRAAAKRLEECKAEWKAAAGKARQKLWALLASIFVAHEILNETEGGRELMIKRVENMPDYSKGDLDPKTKSLLELLVIYSIGSERETAASRCQYTSAVRAATEDPSLERSEKAFLLWLKRKGGIIAAGASHRATGDLVVRFKIDVFKHHIASMARRGTLEFALDPDTEVDDGLTVILASYSAEHPDQLEVVDVVADEGVIERVSRAVAMNRSKKLPDHARQELLNDQYLWDLNRVALKLAKKLSGHVTWKDADRWTRAYHALEGEDNKKRNLFSGFTGVEFSDPTGIDKLTLAVENLDYHELDPGRYIKTARKGSLLPYDPEDAKAVEKYILKHTDPYIYAKPIELTECGEPTAAEVHEDDSVNLLRDGGDA